jgi:hypothetical protein
MPIQIKKLREAGARRPHAGQEQHGGIPLAPPRWSRCSKATRTVPIVLVLVAEPVAAGFVDNLARRPLGAIYGHYPGGADLDAPRGERDKSALMTISTFPRPIFAVLHNAAFRCAML